MKKLILIALALVLAVAFISCGTKHEWVEETYIVQSGDTLWNICDDYCPKEMDIRKYIYIVQKANGISADIYAGQAITLLREVG